MHFSRVYYGSDPVHCGIMAIASPSQWGVLPYIGHIGMCPPPGRVFARFGLKTGIHFADFGVESGRVFEGTAGAYERSYRFYSI